MKLPHPRKPIPQPLSLSAALIAVLLLGLYVSRVVFAS